MKVQEIRSLSEKIKANISRVMVGKDEMTDLVLVALICSGHVLLEDVPGVGKTMLAKCLARSVDCDCKRIQFTPDLLPSDLTGISYYNQKQGEFVFRAGPLFSNIILADEVNRATPRTQSSLLECMEERQVTIDGETRKLSEPFFVIATQNPVETQGTFPLPEAQLDRFFIRLKLGYPSAAEGREILDRFQNGNPFPQIEKVAAAEEVVAAQRSFTAVRVNAAVKDYIIRIIEMSRSHERVQLGISPRGSLALMKGCQALAAIRGRDFVTPDDVKYLAQPVLAHRMILRGHTVTTGIASAEAVVADILKKVPVPLEELE